MCDDARELVGMAEFKQLANSLATLLAHGISLNERMLKHAFEHVMRESIEGMHRQLDRLNAEIRRVSRELDSREDEYMPRAEAEAFLRSWFGRYDAPYTRGDGGASKGHHAQTAGSVGLDGAIEGLTPSTPEPTPDLDAATLAELHRLARSRPQSGRGQTAKLGAIRTLERLGREGKSTSPMPPAVARLFDPSRDESDRVRRMTGPGPDRRCSSWTWSTRSRRGGVGIAIVAEGAAVNVGAKMEQLAGVASTG